MARLRFAQNAQEVFERLSPGEQLEAKKLMEAWEARRLWNPLEAYEPASDKHADFHGSEAKLRAIFGGNRSGKTTTAVVDDIIQAAPQQFVPDALKQFKRFECPFYCRIMTPDMERTMKPVVHQKLRDWLPKSLLRDGSFDRSYDRAAQALRLECGCRFDFLSYEMALDKFGGASLHRCHFDEEPPEDIRNECLYRLIDFDGDEVMSMTPLKGLTWTYRRIWANRLDSGIFTTTIAIHDNPHLSASAIKRVLEATPDDEREMREHGRFFNAGGMVYAGFLRDSTWVDVPLNATIADREVVVGIDPGIRRAGLVWIAFDSDNRGLVFDTRELRDATVADYARELRRVNAQWGLTKEPLYVIDPAARQRSLTNAESVASELYRQGIYVLDGQNDVDAGVMTVRRRLQEGGLVVSKHLIEFRQELEDYALEKHADGTFHPEKSGREHRCDALRYGAMLRPWDVARQAPHKSAYPDDVAFPPPRRRKTVSIMGPMA